MSVSFKINGNGGNFDGTEHVAGSISVQYKYVMIYQ